MIATAVALGTVALALASTSAPVPREVYASAAALAWGLVVLGTLFGILPRAPIPRTAILAGVSLAGFTALSALSMLWASDAGNAFDQILRASGYTGLFVLVVLASRDGEGGWWLRGLAIGLGAVALIAIAPRLLPDLLGSPDADLQAQGRIGYPIRYWNGLAAMMAGAATLLVWLAAQASSRPGRSLAFAATPLVLLVLYMAQSRGGLLAALGAFAVLLAVGPGRQRLAANLALAGLSAIPLIALVRTRTEFLDRPGSELAAEQGLEVLVILVATVLLALLLRARLDRRIARLDLRRTTVRRIGAVAIVVALLGLIAVDPVGRFEDFKRPPTVAQAQEDTQAALITRSGGGRWQFWGTALEGFADEPLIGHGAGEFGVLWNQTGPFGFQVQNAHSLFLEALAELGILGFAAIAGFFAIAAVSGAVRARYVRDGAASVALALLAAGAVSAAFDFVWELPAVFAPIVVVAALLSGSAVTPALINAPPAPERPPRRGRGGLALGIATLVLAWVSLVACALALLSEASLDRSREAVSAGEFRQAIAEADDAAELLPFSAEPRVQLGLALQRAGDLISARRATLEAIERADEDWRWWRQLALIDGISGNLGAACRDIERARRLNPRQVLLYMPIEGLDCPGPEPRPPGP